MLFTMSISGDMDNGEDDLICQVYDYIQLPRGMLRGQKEDNQEEIKKFVVKDGELFYKQTRN